MNSWQRSPKMDQRTAAAMNVQLYLNVPFEQKERVRHLGARWDSALRLWFVPHRIDINQFRDWWPESLKKATDTLHDKKKTKKQPRKSAAKKK